MAWRRAWTTVAAAKELGIPESTVRWYRRQFGAYLPQEGRYLRPEALPLLRAVREAFQRGATREEVQLLLEAKAPPPESRVLAAQEEAVAARKAVAVARAESAEVLHRVREEMKTGQATLEAAISHQAERVMTAIAEQKSVLSRLEAEIGQLAATLAVTQTAIARLQQEQSAWREAWEKASQSGLRGLLSRRSQ